MKTYTIYKKRDGQSFKEVGIIYACNFKEAKTHLKLASENDYLLALENYRVGDKVKVTVERENERIALDLTLDPANE